jgi:nucleotide-binding universal stress UspA family protein
MSFALKPGWSKPSNLLFASEIPVNENAFSFALAQAAEFGARLIVFHAYDTVAVTTSEGSGLRHYDAAAAARFELEQLEPLAERAREARIECETVVRPGLPAEEIVAYVREREGDQAIDRVVMGTHSPGRVGKLLVGSVAEAVLRTARTPVCVIGPQVVNGRYRNFATRTILCGVSLHESSPAVVKFAAELAAEQNARLVLQHVIRPQERQEVLAHRPLDRIETELRELIPEALESSVEVQTIVVPGDPAEELLYWSSAEQADLVVLGAQGASAFAAITRHGAVYKVLAHAHCPVMTLSPLVLASNGEKKEYARQSEVFLAGVF